jgi:tRNA A-37 threonylcarbamoyl transferase component Bud32
MNAVDGDRSKVVFADDAAAALLAGHLGELAAPGEEWVVVKRNVSRTVYRGHIGGQQIYLKHYHSQSPLRRLARLAGRSDAKSEMRFTQYLQHIGVPTVPPLAALCHDGIEWLATKAVAPAVQGDIWHEQQLGAGPAGQAAIRSATIRLGQMIGKMHAAGVTHRDLHCGNILVCPGKDQPQIMVTDLHRALRRRRLSRRDCVASLAQLFHDRYDFTTRSERVRFLRHYLAGNGAYRKGSLRGWQMMIEEFARRHTRRQLRQRDNRIFGSNKYFSPIRLPDRWAGHVVLSSKRKMACSQAAHMVFTLQEWQDAIGNPQSLFEGPGVEVIKDSPSSLVVRRTLRIGENDVQVFVKRTRRKYRWKILLDCLRDARCTRAFELGHKLLTRRIATALPLAALERRAGPVLTDSISIAEAVEATDLDTFMRTWLANPPRDTALPVAGQRQLAQDVLWQLGRMVQRLNDNSFAHRDLKASNVLVRWSPAAGADVVLIDLDGLRQQRCLSMRRRFQGLMRLNVSLLECPVVNHAGRLRMLLGYLRRPGCGRINFKPYWRLLEQWSAEKLNRQIRSRHNRQKAARR